MHEFVFKIKDKLVTVHEWDDVPEEFDHVIKFAPEVPEGPHTEEQHDEIDRWNFRLQSLMEKERARSN